MYRRVDEHAGVVDCLPEQPGLPVVPDDDRDHRGYDLAPVGQPRRLDHPETELAQPPVQIAGVVEHLGEQLASLGRAADPDCRQGSTDGRRHGGSREHERARLHAQEVDHVGRAGDDATARRERLGERGHAQIDAVLHAEQLAGTGAAGSENAERMRLVNHQPRAVPLAQLDYLGQGGHVPFHREDAVDDDQDAAAVADRLLKRVLEPVEPVVAEGA